MDTSKRYFSLFSTNSFFDSMFLAFYFLLLSVKNFEGSFITSHFPICLQIVLPYAFCNHLVVILLSCQHVFDLLLLRLSVLGHHLISLRVHLVSLILTTWPADFPLSLKASVMTYVIPFLFHRSLCLL